MPYIVNAVTQSEHGASGSFAARTAKDALEKAKNLRGQGLKVNITDEKGNFVNEEDLQDLADDT